MLEKDIQRNSPFADSDQSRGKVNATIAIYRTVIRTRRGDHINVPPVGVMNDLPSSVAGINKHEDMNERAAERASRR